MTLPHLNRVFLYVLLSVGWLLGAASPAWASSPQPPEIAARAFVLLDATSGQVLAEREADREVEPASLTKLMTAYLVFEALRAGRIERTQTLTVSERAWRMPGSRLFAPQGAQVPVDALLKGMIVLSAESTIMPLSKASTGTCAPWGANRREPGMRQARSLTVSVCVRSMRPARSASNTR